TVQVLSPNGLEKVEVGQPVTVTWRSGGLTAEETVALMNVGGPSVERWLAARYQVGTHFVGTLGGAAVDLSGLSEPAPAAVYQTLDYSNNGAGSSLRWRLPVADGSYTLRLHFVEPRGYAPGQQQFDIVVNGVVVSANYDVRAAAGATLKAVAASFVVTAGGGNG